MRVVYGAFPASAPRYQQKAHSQACTTQCLNPHALGEQWIEEVSDWGSSGSKK